MKHVLVLSTLYPNALDPRRGTFVARSPEAVAAGINAVLNAPPPRENVAALVEGLSWDANAAALAAHYDNFLAT